MEGEHLFHPSSLWRGLLRQTFTLLTGSENMPWSEKNYPDSMKNLRPRVRNKAIEIANALLDEGMAEGRAIAIGTKKAKEWAEKHK
jgi:uncharacterized protein YoaH (UPF0181 family)